MPSKRKSQLQLPYRTGYIDLSDLYGLNTYDERTVTFPCRLPYGQENQPLMNQKLTELMKNDEEIITLRNNIKKSAQAKVANGTLTVTEMLREVTAENIAMQDKILHEIQLLSAIYELKYTTNQYENK